MAVCWYCHWGWPKQLVDIYREAVASLDDDDPLQFGPSHVVWSDENFDDANIKASIRDCDDPPAYYSDYSERDLAVVKGSLVRLLAVPKGIRECVPDDYDDENPADFPPASNLEMIKEKHRE